MIIRYQPYKIEVEIVSLVKDRGDEVSALIDALLTAPRDSALSQAAVSAVHTPKYPNFELTTRFERECRYFNLCVYVPFTESADGMIAKIHSELQSSGFGIAGLSPREDIKCVIVETNSGFVGVR